MSTFDSAKLLDGVGRRILYLLQENARLSISEIGRQVGLTAPAVAERVRRMEEAGIITGYHAAVNPEKVGCAVLAFIRVSSTDGRCAPIQEFALKQPQISECYCITGETDILIKAMFKSLSELQQLVTELLRYGSVSTSVILTTYLPRRSME